MTKKPLSEHNNNSNVNHFGEGDNDLLQRRKPGDALSKLMESFEKPRVVALNGNWGTGKTWFLERWAKHHQTKFADTTVVYFDAFEHDYISEPLPALVSALGKEIPGENMERIKEAAFKFAKPLAQKALSIAAPGTSEIVAMVGEFIKSLTDEKEYWANEKERLEGMDKFRSALETMTSPENGKRVIFIVDELDRCRPDYALEVLEVIKHFFSVDNVHFILGVNLKALEDMVSARYGAGGYATEYLEKFIHIKLALPEEVGSEGYMVRDILKYLIKLCEEMKVPEDIGSILKQQVQLVARNNPISLRQIEHIVTTVTLALGNVGTSSNLRYGKIVVMINLIISRIIRPDLYSKFLNANIPQEELEEYLGVNNKVDFKRGYVDGIYGRGLAYSLQEHYHIWLFLTGNELFAEVANDDQQAIKERLLPLFYEPDRVQELPKEIEREWLDLFQFNEST